MACPNTVWGAGWGFSCETPNIRVFFFFFYNKTKQELNEVAQLSESSPANTAIALNHKHMALGQNWA